MSPLPDGEICSRLKGLGFRASRMTAKTDRELAPSNIAENRKAYHDYHLLETFKPRDADRETRAAVKAHRR